MTSLCVVCSTLCSPAVLSVERVRLVFLQNELRMFSAALGESKHQLLQKMAGTVDRPACKQLEVGQMGKNLESYQTVTKIMSIAI